MSEITRHDTDVEEAKARDAQDGIVREVLAWVPAVVAMAVGIFGLLYGMWWLETSYSYAFSAFYYYPSAYGTAILGSSVLSVWCVVARRPRGQIVARA